jgi:hypothetical protein
MRWTVPIERLAVLTAARSGGEENERDCKAPVGPQGGRGHLDKWGDTVDVHNVRADGPEVKVIDMAKEKKDQEEHPPRSPSRRQSTRCSVTLGTRTHRYAEVD